MNIAEGSAKRGSRELRRYLDISLGSLSELAYCTLLARDLGYLSGEEWEQLDAERNLAGKLLWGLYGKVRNS
jgi:four helix bundle protein